MNPRVISRRPARRGAVMIVVLGMITIMLGLALGLTVKVYNGVKGGVVTQQNAQAWIMMQAARKLVLSGATIPPAGVTIGDLAPTDLLSKELDDRLGWARIRPQGGDYDVIACGGSSGSGGKVLITDGPAIRNAMDVRYYYVMAPTGSVTLQPIAPDNYASKW